MILERELEGLTGPLREKIEKQITRSIREALLALQNSGTSDLGLTLIKCTAKIKASVELARELQERSA